MGEGTLVGGHDGARLKNVSEIKPTRLDHRLSVGDRRGLGREASDRESAELLSQPSPGKFRECRFEGKEN